jgi:hypothetical protein
LYPFLAADILMLPTAAPSDESVDRCQLVEHPRECAQQALSCTAHSTNRNKLRGPSQQWRSASELGTRR